MFKRLYSLLTSSVKLVTLEEQAKQKEAMSSKATATTVQLMEHDCGHTSKSYSLGKDGKTKCRECREKEINGDTD